MSRCNRAFALQIMMPFDQPLWNTIPCWHSKWFVPSSSLEIISKYTHHSFDLMALALSEIPTIQQKTNSCKNFPPSYHITFSVCAKSQGRSKPWPRNQAEILNPRQLPQKANNRNHMLGIWCGASSNWNPSCHSWVHTTRVTVHILTFAGCLGCRCIRTKGGSTGKRLLPSNMLSEKGRADISLLHPNDASKRKDQYILLQECNSSTSNW